MIRRAWAAWLNELRFARRCLPWWAAPMWVMTGALAVASVILVVLCAAAAILASLLGCTGHTRVRVGLDVPILEIPLVSVVSYERADVEAVRAGARLSDSPGLSLGLFGGPDGAGGGGGGL